MKQVIGYLRVSSQQQASDGTSIDRQKEQILAYCQDRGIDASNVQFIADEGISGYKTTARKGYLELCGLCLKKKVSAVIVYDLSRISRNTEETLHFINSIAEKNKVKFISLKDEIDSTTSTGKFMLTILAGLNEQYRNVISEKTRAALQHKKANNEKTGGIVPFGYEVTTDGKLLANDDEQTAIKYIYNLRSNGYSLRGIAQELKQLGIKTKTGKSNWSAKVIKTILEKEYTTESLETLATPLAAAA